MGGGVDSKMIQKWRSEGPPDGVEGLRLRNYGRKTV